MAGMPDPFDLDHFLALPRLSGLRLSPDGRRLVTSVATVAPDGKSMRSALWSIDPTGTAVPRRLTRSATGESNGDVLPDGSIVFVSRRTDPDAKPGDPVGPDDRADGLWHLPADGGEARLLLAPPAGILGLAVAALEFDRMCVAGAAAVAVVLAGAQRVGEHAVFHVKHRHVLVRDGLEPRRIGSRDHRDELSPVQVIARHHADQVLLGEDLRGQLVGDV